MSRNLDDLDLRLRPLADQLIARANAEVCPVTVITTLRTPQAQAQAVADGVSWTLHSLHLPQPPEGKSLAIDIAPTELIPTKGWSPSSPLWAQIGAIGQELGLKWGVWKNGINIDPGHYEMVLSGVAPSHPTLTA